MAAEESAGRVVIGRIGAVFGIKGWLKVWSHTDPADGILNYPVWQLRIGGKWETHRFDAVQRHDKAPVVHFPGCDDRDVARRFVNAEIAVAASELPVLAKDEYYWFELEGMRVIARGASGERSELGRVDHLFETGANDVLVVRGEGEGGRERLIPWVPEQVILEVDRAAREILVDWDPDF